MGFAQVDEPDFPVQFLTIPVNGGAHVQHQEKRCPPDVASFVQQGLAHAGQLNVPVGRVKTLQPIGREILLSWPQREGARYRETVIPYVATPAVSGNVMSGIEFPLTG